MSKLLQTITSTEIRESQTHGKGLFATRDFQEGFVLTVLDGQRVPHNDDIDFMRKYEWNAVNDDDILIRPVWTSYGYINHTRPANLTIDATTFALTCAHAIENGEELTLDYTENGFPDVYLKSPHGQYLL